MNARDEVPPDGTRPDDRRRDGAGGTAVVHYLNQFFAGIGGEEKAGTEPVWLDGARGPGKLLDRQSSALRVVGTVAAGDNFMAEQIEEGVDRVVALIETHVAEHGAGSVLLIAGPAFNAGRYGLACAAVCRAAEERLGIRAVTAVYPENPAVDQYRRYVTMVQAADSVLGMDDAIAGLARVGLKRLRGEAIVPHEDGTIARGLRQNYFSESTGAERAIAMLMRKLAGDPHATEYVLPVFDRVPPAPPVEDLSRATVAVVTSGGIVPRGNPDRIEAASASKYGAYSIAGLDRLTAESHESVHGGYDRTYANADPNRVLPLDVLRELEREGRIGALHDTYYATVGNATSVSRAVKFGEEIAASLVNVGVHAVIVTST
jgi:betaine reductase